MKRLTLKDENGCFLTDKTATVTWNSLIGENRYRGEAVDRLAAIEDILGDEYDLDELKEMVQAKREGRCVVPYCKVGDTVYAFSQMRDKRILPFIKEYEITSIRINKRSLSYYHEKDGFIKIMKQSDFGKTVYLTRAEAMAALRREQE